MPLFPLVTKPFNSASLWASTFDDLKALYTSPYTGALTTRTACSVDTGFPHDKSVHQHTFFSTSTQTPLPQPPPASPSTTHPASNPDREVGGVSTLNTLGYSPYPLRYYVESVQRVQGEIEGAHKPVIFSVAGSSTTILACFAFLAKHHDPISRPWEQWCMEVNLSCPNIPGAVPPAYSMAQLARLLNDISTGVRGLIAEARRHLEGDGLKPDRVKSGLKRWDISIGLKLPPYTYETQFDDVVREITRENARIREVALGLDAPSFDSSGQKTSFLRDGDVRNFMKTKNMIYPETKTIDTALLSAERSMDLDATLAEDLAVSLSLDDALSRSSGNSSPENGWDVLEPPFPISFITSTNTLGSCLNMEDSFSSSDSAVVSPTLNSTDGSGIGGLGGAALHPLSLGNVKNIADRLQRNEDTSKVTVIGVGGVCDYAGFERMKSAGAGAVALATALGAKGISIFKEIIEGPEATSNH